jgi:hypothetical protein
VLALQPRLESLLLSPTLGLYSAAFVRPQALFVKVPTKTGLQSEPAAPTKIRLVRVSSAGRGRDYWIATTTAGLMVDWVTIRSWKKYD